MEQDLQFFELAQQEPFHFQVQQLFSKQMTPQWPDDDFIYGSNSISIRSTIYFYELSPLK